MSLRQRFRNALTWPFRRRRRPYQKDPASHKCRPFLEALEDRTLLSINLTAPATTWLAGDSVPFTAATDDPGGAGLRSLTYRTSGAVNSGPITGGPPLDVQIAKEGVTHFEFSATDNAGNAESPDKKATVRLDKTPPETFYQLAYGGPTTTVTLYSTDLLSGVKSITYQASGAQVIPSTTVPGSQATFVITQNGVTSNSAILPVR